MNNSDLFIGLPWVSQVLSVLELLGVLGGLSYLFKHGLQWIRNNYLSKDEMEILLQAAWNEHRILFKPERSSHPLHIRFNWNSGPYPSEDKEEVMRHVALFERLIDKGFIRHAENEIHVLTVKGIRATKRKTLPAAWHWLSQRRK